MSKTHKLLYILPAQSADVNSVAVTSRYASYQTLNKYGAKICDNALDAIKYIKNYDRK